MYHHSSALPDSSLNMIACSLPLLSIRHVPIMLDYDYVYLYVESNSLDLPAIYNIPLFQKHGYVCTKIAV